MPLILTDVDDTLLCWSDAFTRWVVARGYQPAGSLIEVYRIHEWLGVGVDHALGLVAEFQQDEENFSTLEAYPGAQDGVARLVAAGYRLVAITACGQDPRLSDWRYRNLHALFGPVFDGLVLVPLNGSKAQKLTDYTPTWWIEDNFNHAVTGVRCGHRSLLLDYPHNRRQHAKVERVQSWGEITDLILDNRIGPSP